MSIFSPIAFSEGTKLDPSKRSKMALKVGIHDRFEKIDFSIFDLLPATNSEKRFTGPQQALSSPLSTLKLPNSKLLFRAVLRAIQSEALEIWLVRYWALESRENQSVEETFQNLFFALFRAYQGLETGWKCYRLILGCVWWLGQKSSKIDHI